MRLLISFVLAGALILTTGCEHLLVPCDSDWDCPGNDLCVNGFCEDPYASCDSDWDCAGGAECVLGTCSYASYCLDNSECGSGQICLYESCVTAWGMEYEITIMAGVISDTKSSGEPWDIDGSPADPYVKVYLNDQLLGTTDYEQDDSLPIWSTSFYTYLDASDELSFEVWDDDIFDNDYIGGFYDPYPIEAILRGTASSYTDVDGLLEFNYLITPAL